MSNHNEEDDESFPGLTAREEADLERLMEQCDFTIVDAEAFTEKLSREVSEMDASNIQSLMASEARVANLMSIIQVALDETSKLESRVEHYQNQLRNVRDTVFQVERKETLVQVQADNTIKLKDELELLISKLDFPREQEYILSDGDLTSDEGIDACIKAANVLNQCLNADINPVLCNLAAVTEQKQMLMQIQTRFGNRIANHVIAVLIFFVNEYGDNNLQLINSADLVLPNHSLFYGNLLSYTPLLKWCKKSHKQSFDRIFEQYVSIMKGQYQREIQMFFEYIRDKMTAGKGSTTGSQGENSSVGTGSRRTRSSSIQGTSDFLDTISSKSSEISLSEWEDFDNLIDRMLSAIDPVCLGEQQFCIEFFDFAPASIPLQQAPTQSQKMSRRRGSHHSPSKSSSPSPSHQSNQSRGSSDLNDPKKTEELRVMMTEIFEILELELEKFTSYYNQLDGVYSMYIMVRLTQHVLSAQDTGCFLVKVYGKILILVKRNFDSFMENQKRGIEEAKAPKRPKCGVLPFIKKFEALAKQAELVFKQAGTRRTDIDRWYVVLVRCIFDAINRIAVEHTKTPAEMIRIENNHALLDVLRALKIPCLKNELTEAKVRYDDAVKDYVGRYFGRPLEKLNIFFDGVQQKMSQGVRAEEISFQLAYSKAELKKVIRDCSLREVKRGLEDMYRRVEKHAFEAESTLIQVIWRSMQEEFLVQYKGITELMQRCYPDSSLTLAFGVNDVLNVFSEIARSH